MAPTRKLGHMLYSRRAIKMREFNEFLAADTFARVISHLAGVQVGSVMIEHQRRLQDYEALSDIEKLELLSAEKTKEKEKGIWAMPNPARNNSLWRIQPTQYRGSLNHHTGRRQCYPHQRT